MATRVKLFRNNGALTTSFTVVNDIDGAVNMKPPSGIKWTMVEIRIGMSGQVGEWKINYDTEKYYNGRSEIDFLAKGKPHTVTIDVVQPHFIELQAKSDVA